MVTIMRWTGREARVLRDVLRMSVRDFASHTGLSASAIADMEAKGQQAQLRHTTQQILDEVLTTSPEEARQRFCAILGPAVLQTAETRAASQLVSPRHEAFQAGSVEAEQIASLAAQESWRHAASVGAAVDPAGIEQVRVQVRRLAHRYHELAPLRLLQEARQTRDLTYILLSRTHRPSQMADLDLTAGLACGLLAMASFDLAQWDAATDQIRAAGMYAELVDHAGLQSWSAGTLALVTYWAGRPREAVTVLDAAERTTGAGVAAARLHAIRARAWSHLGNTHEVTTALHLADEAMDAADGSDEVQDEVGGEFGWGRSLHSACAGSALLEVGDAAGAAERIRAALQAMPSDPCAGLVPERARADLAAAEIVAGQFDAAVAALEDVWATPVQHRRHGLTARMQHVQQALAAPSWRGHRPAAALRDRIGEFVTEAVASRALPAPRGNPLLPRGE